MDVPPLPCSRSSRTGNRQLSVAARALTPEIQVTSNPHKAPARASGSAATRPTTPRCPLSTVRTPISSYPDPNPVRSA